MANLLHDNKGVWKHLAIPSFSSCCFLFSITFFTSTTTLTAGTETSHITEDYSDNNEKAPSYTDAVLKEEFAAECLWLACDQTTAIATRQETPISKAPGIVTVITAEEIKNSGYRTFIEILRTVPGFEILKDVSFGAEYASVRGLISSMHTRIMLNGHHVNSPLSSGAFDVFDDFPVEHIKRIEIIRGPASAIYGENAFLAVINIITFDARDIDGVKVSSGYGSFDTHDENITFGKTFGKLDVSGMVRYRQTNGFDGVIESDFQTIIDDAFSGLYPAASQAPGAVEDWRQEYDLNLKVLYKDIYIEGLYINKNRGAYISPQFAMTDGSYIESNYVYGEAGYKKTFEEQFTVKPRIYYDQFDNNFYIKSLPDGTTVPWRTNGDGIYNIYTYPNGIIGNGKVINRIVGAEIPFDYKVFDGNTFTLGLEYRYINQGNISYSSNLDPVTYEPMDSLQDYSDTYPFLKEATRRVWSVYLQDTWDITDTVNFTLGVRHDRYSDFGGATSPRIGLSWAFMKDASLKLLYGEAFRPPSFLELFTTNQPAIQGNENLDPEKVRTYEIGLSYQFNRYVASSINYFYNDIEDIIVLRSLPTVQNSQRYENFGNAHVQGIEMETKVDIVEGNYLFMNYTFQNPKDDDGEDMPFVAHHFGNFGVNIHYWKYINTNLSTFVSGKRSREEGDTRSDLPAYALLNLSVIYKEFFKTMEIQGTVFNLLDKDYSDPGPTSIPDDLPRPGRTFFVGLSYQF